MHQLLDALLESQDPAGMNPESRTIQYEVFGIGSSHGADQVAWRVLDYLRADPLRANAYRIHRLQSPADLLGYASSIGSHEHAASPWILVDACIGQSDGNVHCWRWPAVPESAIEVGCVSSHALGLIDALRLGQELGVLPELVWIYGIEVGVAISKCHEPHSLQWEPSVQMQDAIANCASQIASRSD